MNTYYISKLQHKICYFLALLLVNTNLTREIQSVPSGAPWRNVPYVRLYLCGSSLDAQLSSYCHNELMTQKVIQGLNYNIVPLPSMIKIVPNAHAYCTI